MIYLFAVSINISPLSGAKTIFGQGRGQKIKNKVLFFPKSPSILHQPEMFSGSRAFAHSLFIESKLGSGGEPPAFGDFGDIPPK